MCLVAGTNILRFKRAKTFVEVDVIAHGAFRCLTTRAAACHAEHNAKMMAETAHLSFMLSGFVTTPATILIMIPSLNLGL